MQFFLAAAGLAQLPTVCDVYDTTAFLNEMGTAVLDDSCMIQILSPGIDSVIAPPIENIAGADNGSPTGDDELIGVFAVGNAMPPATGRSFFTLTIHQDSSARPYTGELLYARVFNRKLLQNATYYEDSQIYSCLGENGEAFIITLPNDRTNQCLSPFVRVALPDTLGVDGTQVSIPLELMQDPTDLSLWGYECRIIFADSVLAHPVVSDSNTLTDQWEITEFSNVGDTLYIHGQGTTPLAETGTIVNITFDVVGQPGDSTGLTFEYLDFNLGDPPGQPTNGSFKIVPKADLAGSVRFWATQIGVADAEVLLTGGQTDTLVTDLEGLYNRCCLAVGLDYSMSPTKIGDFNEASINAYDASMAARLALQLIEPTDQFQQMASDADRDNRIIAYDAACIARRAVGLEPLAGSKVGEWVFDPVEISYTPLMDDQLAQNFVAVLLGDVDGNWAPAGAALAKTDLRSVFSVDNEVWAEPHQNFDFEFPAPIKTEVLSFDIDVSYSAQMVKVLQIEKTDFSRNFQVVSNSEAGRLRIAAYSPRPVWSEESKALLRLIFEMRGDEGEADVLSIKRFQINNQQIYRTEVSVKAGADPLAKPKEFALRQNYPNPFNPETQIRFDLPKPCDVRLEIFNLLGQRVRMLIDKNYDAGYHSIHWEATNDFSTPLPSGVYLYRITTAGFVQDRKMILLR